MYICKGRSSLRIRQENPFKAIQLELKVKRNKNKKNKSNNHFQFNLVPFQWQYYEYSYHLIFSPFIINDKQQHKVYKKCWKKANTEFACFSLDSSWNSHGRLIKKSEILSIKFSNSHWHMLNDVQKWSSTEILQDY